MSALGRRRNGSVSSSRRWSRTRSRWRVSRDRRNDNASSERTTSSFAEGIESGLRQNPHLALEECALFGDFHQPTKDVIVALPLPSKNPQPIPGGLADGHSGSFYHYCS